jgi:hypothetical protein
MCDPSTRECGVVFVEKIFVRRGDKLKAMHAHHFQSQQTVHTLPPEELQSLKHSRHTNQFAHMIDQANHTSYYWEKKGV